MPKNVQYSSDNAGWVGGDARVLSCAAARRDGDLHAGGVLRPSGDACHGKAGLDGHYRYYGIEVCDAFAEAGFAVRMIDMGEGVDAKWGVRSGDMAFVCTKTKPEEGVQA